MKKIIILVAVVFISLQLSGCGCEKDKDEKGKNKTQIEMTIENLYTDEGKLVYNNNDIYKIVYYFSGDEITGLEHYYEYANETEAEAKYKEYKETLKNDASIKKITRSGKYVVYTMAGERYEGKTVEQVKNSYSYLVPVYEK